MSNLALALRDCARGLLKTAREVKQDGNHSESARLAKRARFHWHWYLREIF